MVTLDDIRAARTLLHGIAVRTPLFEWTGPTEQRKLYLKLENLQPIGAFKLRGAYNKVASLSSEERRRGVISYSSGNHAQGVAYAARALGVKAIIVMPGNAPKNKLDATAALGAEIVTVGPSSEERRLRAEQLAAEHGYAIVPPYNDEKIIAGQGTVGLEILEDLPNVETVLVPVGGGGLISGVSAAIKLSNTALSHPALGHPQLGHPQLGQAKLVQPRAKVIGVEPELASDARASLRAGRIVSFPAEQVSQTLADGLRTQSIGAINFEHIRAYVDDIVSVTEDEIREAMRALSANAKTLAEPSGAVAAAAFLFHADELPKTAINVAVISGGNIDPTLLAELGRR
ncbi:MAG: threonine/serine dehydratase [Terriglobales bacterium]|jgi:threonine dehydratase